MTLFTSGEYIKKSKLGFGCVYVFKDGYVRIYLGEAKKTGEMVFYTVCCMAFTKTGKYVKPIWGDRQEEMLFDMCKEVLHISYNVDAIANYSSLPSIYGSIGKAYSAERIENWLTWNNRGGLLKYATESKPSLDDKGYVLSKDLRPGSLYYSGTAPYRNTYMYIGRTISGEYLWFYIGSDELFKESPCRWMRSSANYSDFVTTKTNKKVRPLTKYQNKLIGGMHIDLSPIFEYLADIHDLKL